MSRRRRYLISGAVLVACVCIVIGVISMLPTRPGVTKANFDRIEVGMTLAEVEDIFGRDPDWRDVRRPTAQVFIWYGDDRSIATVEYIGKLPDHATVIDRHWQVSNESIPDKLRRWLHLPK